MEKKKEFKFEYTLVPGSVWRNLKTTMPDPSGKKSQEIWCDNEVTNTIRDNGGIFISDKFMPLMNIESGIIFAYGGWGSGKTSSVLTKFLIKALTTQGYRTYYGRNEKTLTRELKDNIIEEIERNGWQDYFEYSKEPTGTLIISCKPTGSVFIGFGCDKEDGSKGWNNPHAIIVDEINQIDFETFGMLLTRLRTPGRPLLFVGMFNNPDVFPDHWLPKYIFAEEVKGDEMTDADRVVMASLADSKIIKHHSTYLDNQFMNPDMYYPKIVIKAKGDPVRSEAYAKGKWGVKLNAQPFYKAFEVSRHTGFAEYNPELCLWVSFDENVNPYLPVGLFQIVGKQAVMVDEIAAESPNNYLRWVCGEIVRKYHNIHRGGMKVTGDATSKKGDTKLEQGKDFFQLAMEYLAPFKPELRVRDSNPNVAKRGNFINDIFRNSFNGITILIARQCRHMIEDLTNIEESPDGNGKNKVKEKVNGVAGVQRYGHFCFTGDTMVKTIFGDKPISTIKKGDYILTRNGYKRVLANHDNGFKKVETYFIGNSKITCTPNHFFWTGEHGFIEIEKLHDFNKNNLIHHTTFCIFDEKEICKKKLSFTKEEFLQGIQIPNEGLIGFTTQGGSPMMEGKRKSDYINTFGGSKMVKYLKGITFIILMAIRSITTSIICNVLTALNIFQNTEFLSQWRYRNLEKTCYLLLQDLKQANGINRKREDNGIESKLKEIKRFIDTQEHASNAVADMKKLAQCLQSFAQTDVENGLPQEHSETRQRVYDLSIEGQHEYFANNVLVSNTDLLDYFICEAFFYDYQKFQHGGTTQNVKSVGRTTVHNGIGGYATNGISTMRLRNRM